MGAKDMSGKSLWPTRIVGRVIQESASPPVQRAKRIRSVLRDAGRARNQLSREAIVVLIGGLQCHPPWNGGSAFSCRKLEEGQAPIAARSAFAMDSEYLFTSS